MTTPVTQQSFKFSATLKAIMGLFVIVGVATFTMAAMKNPERAWPNFLINFFFFLFLSLSGAFFTALQHVTNAYWSVTIRRLSEALMSYLPVALVLGLVLFSGRHYLYEWTHAEALTHDAALGLKSAYLNNTFFAIRFFGIFLIWIFLGFKIRKNSLDQDQNGDHRYTLANIKLSTLFLVLFGVTSTLMSYDIIMSLEPHWFSTMFGVYCFAGLFYSGLAMLAWLIFLGRKQGVFTEQQVNDNHIHDIGKLMFGFTVFWAYIMFSQLMLIWYANIPEETVYFIRRFHGGWMKYFWALFAIHFLVPFFGLLPRAAKRCRSYLAKMAMLMLFAQWFDVYYLVMPVFAKEGPVFGWIEVGTFLGFLGLFVSSVGRFLEKNPAIPQKDPRILQCIHHAQ